MALTEAEKTRRLRARRKAKKDAENIDGLGPKDLRRIRAALRDAWRWSVPRKLCLARAIGPDGFPRCEACKRKVPQVTADHVTPVGEIDSGVIERMWCPSAKLRALCKKCHRVKTNADNRGSRARKRIIALKARRLALADYDFS